MKSKWFLNYVYLSIEWNEQIMCILLGNKIPFFFHLTVSLSLPVARIIFLKSSQIQSGGFTNLLCKSVKCLERIKSALQRKRSGILLIPAQGGWGGGETRSGTEKRCSHNLQSGHPAWWSADNYSILPTVNIFRLFRSKKRTDRGNQKCLKNWKKSYHASLFFLHIVFVFRYWNAGETKTQPC